MHVWWSISLNSSVSDTQAHSGFPRPAVWYTYDERTARLVLKHAFLYRCHIPYICTVLHQVWADQRHLHWLIATTRVPVNVCTGDRPAPYEEHANADVRDDEAYGQAHEGAEEHVVDEEVGGAGEQAAQQLEDLRRALRWVDGGGSERGGTGHEV